MTGPTVKGLGIHTNLWPSLREFEAIYMNMWLPASSPDLSHAQFLGKLRDGAQDFPVTSPPYSDTWETRAQEITILASQTTILEVQRCGWQILHLQ